MNKSMKLKKDMEDLMKNLQEDLKEWNKKLFGGENNINNNNIINDKKIIKQENIKQENFEKEKNDNENEKNKINENNKKEKESNENENNNSDVNNNENETNNNRIIVDENNKNENKNNEKEIDNISNISNNSSNEKNNMIDPINEINILNKEKSNNNLINIANFLNIPLNGNKIVDQDFIRKVVKKWIIGQTFLLKIYLFVNKKAFCYRMASKGKEEDKFIINTIQGNNNYIPLIERMIDDSIKKLNLSSFRNNEIGTLKKFLKKLNKINNYDYNKIISFLNNENENEKKTKKKKLNEKLK